MHSLLLSLIIVSSGLADDPTPTPTPPPSDSPLQIWQETGSGQYPWPIVELPVVPTVPAASISIPTPSHSDSYVLDEAELEYQIDTLSSPVSDLEDASGLFLGSGGALSEMDSGGDFDTGIDPTGEGETLDWYEAADTAGASVGQSFTWARTAVELVSEIGGLGSAGAFVIFNLFVIGLVILVRFIAFAIRIGGSLWDVLVDVVNTILEFIPL